MSSVNKVILLGNIGKDPETRYMPNGDAVTNFSLATSETWKDKNGEKVEKTEWHRITVFRKLAEIVGEYGKKGKQVYIEGKIQTTKYTDKKTGEEKYSTEIVAHEFKMVGSRPPQGEDNSGGKSHDSESQEPQKTGTSFDDMDDDIPFN